MKVLHLLVGVSALSVCESAIAQEASDIAAVEETSAESQSGSSSGSLLDEIVVNAQKKSKGERAQDVPVAITVLGTEQIDALNLRSLTDISAIAPNANLDPNGTVRGYANFAVRGSGLNSSVPTVEPAVGLFVDGVYQGVSAGSVSDNFDLANVQILRGPQGTLFGKNVTGGGVLVETARPSGDFGGYVEASVETGPEYALKGAIEAPLVADLLSARLAAYYRKDEGWFRNDFDGSKFGKIETFIVRPSFVFRTDALTQTFIFEYGDVSGDSNAPRARNAAGKFDVNLNYRGANDQEWYSATSETVINVGFGDGTITNVFGYRGFKQFAGQDMDASPANLFHLGFYLDQEQISDELRYAGTFGPVELTVGGYYMHQDLIYREARNPFVAGARGGGGVQPSDTYGVFGQATINLTDQLNIIGGLRYSYEKKSARILALTNGRCLDPLQPCDFDTAPTVNSNRSWSNLNPKIGINYKLNPDALLYASFGQGIRAGGYNVRLSGVNDPGVYDQEDMTSYEIGVKADLLDRKLRINAAAFINDYKSLQRTNTTFIGPNIVQLISNSADARIKGVEVEVTAQPVRGLEVIVGGGYLDAYYTDVRGDLNGDAIVNAVDLGLKLTRVPKWSFSAGAIYSHDFASGGSLRGQVFYSYRSRQAAQDSNIVFYPPFNDVRADITFTLPNESTSISLFGRNLTNEAHNVSGISVLSFPSGGFEAIGEGRSVGIELRQSF